LAYLIVHQATRPKPAWRGIRPSLGGNEKTKENRMSAHESLTEKVTETWTIRKKIQVRPA
jgi:hypothetical protein